MDPLHVTCFHPPPCPASGSEAWEYLLPQAHNRTGNWESLQFPLGWLGETPIVREGPTARPREFCSGILCLHPPNHVLHPSFSRGREAAPPSTRTFRSSPLPCQVRPPAPRLPSPTREGFPASAEAWLWLGAPARPPAAVRGVPPLPSSSVTNVPHLLPCHKTAISSQASSLITQPVLSFHFITGINNEFKAWKAIKMCD